MHDLLFEHQDALRPQNLHDYAAQLDLDLDRFVEELRKHVRAHEWLRTSIAPTQRRVRHADLLRHGRRHHGAYDIESLTAAVRVARAQHLARS